MIPKSVKKAARDSAVLQRKLWDEREPPESLKSLWRLVLNLTEIKVNFCFPKMP